MKDIYVLDACALIALLKNEPGAEIVANVYEMATSGKVRLVMHKLNLLEIYYDQYRSFGADVADKVLDAIKKSPIKIIPAISDAVFTEAGRLKAHHKISLADSICLALATAMNGYLLTADHHEFDAIQKNEPIRFCWIR